jgi:hypothetical protein
MARSDLWVIHQRNCKNGKKEVSLVAELAMKSLLVGTGRLPLQSVQLSWQPCLRLQAVWGLLLTRWYDLDGNGMVLV